MRKMIKDIISNKKKKVEILIVEDSPTQALKLKYLLEEHNFSYVWAKNGLEALNKTKENKPDLIVSDIVMPKMDGYELCRNIKTDNTLKNIPVILLTALTGTENIIKGLDVNADFYITKPYEENFLISKINLLLSKKITEQSEVDEELEIILDGKTHRISANRKQILNLLLSTHENLVFQNQTLAQTQKALRKLNKRLEEKVREKTAHLLTEIAERKRSEERIVHLNAVLQAIRDVNQLITKVKDRERLLQGACDNLIKIGGYNSAWIALIEEENIGFITAAQAEAGDGFSAMVDGLKRGELTRCMRQAADQSGVLVVAEPDLECGDCPLVGIYAGKARLIARLEHEGRIYGFINVTVSVRLAVDEEERWLFEEVAGDIAFALHNMELEKERKMAEEALCKSEEKYRTLYDSSMDAIMLLTPEEEFLSGNPAAVKIFGCKDEKEFTSRTPQNLSPRYQSDGTLSSEKNKQRMAIAMEKGSHFFEWTYKRVDGQEFPATVLLTRMELQGRRMLQARVRDITERKQAQEERKKLEDQLSQSQRMQAIGVLAGGVAHDFNNLLTIIIGNAQLALMDVIKDESLRNGIEETMKAGERAASLIRQLLAFSRKQIIAPRVLDLNELLTGIEKMLARLIGEDIELLTIIEPALWQVEVDPGQVEQVIMNLTVNASDAMPRGGKLTIETANIDLAENYFHEHGIKNEPGFYVMLTVSDTGSGMDKETQEHIFEPFFTTKEVGKGTGTGLGLSTVYGILKQNNGFVWVYSEPGQGSTFKVYLPKAEGDADSEEKQRLPVIELDGSETILIVEDDNGLRKFAQNVLQQHGYKVLDAENGEDALRVSQAHEGPIHLMITDVVMPRMGGKEAAERLQAFYPRMKVIYMSGYTDNAIVEHGVLAPGLNFLQKPFTPESLARKVREMLDKSQS